MFLKSMKYVFMYLQLFIERQLLPGTIWILRIHFGVVDRFISSTGLNKLLNLSVPQIPHLKNVLGVGSWAH